MRGKALVIVVLAILVAAGLGIALLGGQREIETGRDKVVRIPAGIDHSDYERLLKTYVNERGLVNYAAWLDHSVDRQALKEYLEQYTPAPENGAENGAEGTELSAALINAYNAFAMDYVLDHYPIESIMALSHPFVGRRFTVGGEQVSLDDIEHANLLPHHGYRSHAVVVCVARTCPPLRREAYVAERLDEQVTDTFGTWLAREDLNRFHPEKNRVEVSKVFEWFGGDFENAGGLRTVLARYGSQEHKKFLSRDDYKIEFLPYDWALNDQELREYTRLRQGWNRFLDFFR